MCEDFIEIADGQIKVIKGKFKKGHFVLCSFCGLLELGIKGNIKNTYALKKEKK